MNKMNFTDEQIEYIKNACDHVEMLCGGRGKGKTHKLINEMQNKINNLQSKIDKAIDKINQYELIVGYYDSNYDEYNDTYSHEIKEELLDILKEEQPKETKELFEGTMDQLNDLSIFKEDK